VRILLPLAQQVRHLRHAQEERLHEAYTDPTSPRGRPHSTQHDPATALAPSGAGTPAANSAVHRPTDSSPPTSSPAPSREGER
jgi:hypothetical protein